MRLTGPTATSAMRRNDSIRALGCAAALALVACSDSEDGASPSPTDETATPTPASPQTATFVLAALGFYTSPEEDGTVRGLDIDGHSDDVCGKADKISPDGTPGIDNQLAVLGPALEAFGAGSVRAIVQDAVNQGLLLVGVEVGDVNDWEHDDFATLHVFLVEGDVDVGTNGVLEPNRTYWPRDYPAGNVAAGEIVDGVLFVEDLNFILPIQILGIDVDFVVDGARAELRLDELEHSLQGDVAGGVPLEVLDELADDVVEASGGDEGLGNLVRSAFNGNADLAPDEDGVCQRLSAAMEFVGVRAFVVPAEFGAGTP